MRKTHKLDHRPSFDSVALMMAFRPNTMTSLIASLRSSCPFRGGASFYVITDPVDDFSGAIFIALHTVECLPDLAQVRRLHGDPVKIMISFSGSSNGA
jgi:hypothetical protein